MKALVTGGAGFIGSHLAKALCERGAEVVVLDDFSSGQEVNLAWVKSSDRLEVVRGSVTDAALLARIVPGCEWVFHQAAVASVTLSVDDPWATQVCNADGTLQVLLAARAARIRRVLFASSSAIYGDSEVVSKREELPAQPLSPYGLQKYAGERYAQLFHQLYGLETVALRYFNVFGPGQSFDSPYSGVIARFCTAMLAGQPPTIFGDGQQARDFTYVENVVQANLAAAAASTAKVAGKVFNIAGGRSINLLQLVEALNEATGQNLSPAFLPGRAGDIRFSQADIRAAQEAFGYALAVGWQAGLLPTLEYYRQQGGADA